MIKVERTGEFVDAVKSIRDRRAKAKIALRIDRLEEGNPGDVKPVGDGVSEMRINYGPGYRIYFTYVGKAIVLLLMCGDKSSQDRDIVFAKELKQRYVQEQSP